MHQLAHKAYSDVTTRTAGDKQIEYAVFSQITEALRDIAAQETPPPAPWADAIDRNLQLWLLLSIDLLNPDNELAGETRKGLITLSEQVRRLSYKVLAGEGDINDLVEINETIMRGLSGDTSPGLMEVIE